LSMRGSLTSIVNCLQENDFEGSVLYLQMSKFESDDPPA